MEVQIYISGNVTSFRVASEEVAKANAAYKSDQFKEFYIGGLPQELRERYRPVHSLIFGF